MRADFRKWCSSSMLEELGLIGTIGEDDEVPGDPESDSGDEEEEEV